MSIVNAGLVWGVPVRPDLLGQHLHAYKKILPTLNTLRLCHRFGKGSNVHITRIPLEVEQAIENIVFERELSWYPFMDAFEHFESRCAPVDHVEDGYSDIFEDAHEQINSELCDKCKDDSSYAESTDECSEGCIEKVTEHMNWGLLEVGGHFEICDEVCGRWEALINQTPNGGFAPYDKILHEHFGVEAYFATTRVTEGNREAWPTDPNHMWHAEKELQTTICYLTLPRTMAGDREYPVGEMEVDCGYFDIHGTASCIVESPTLHDRAVRVKQFQRVLRILKLKPYVHESQLNTKVSATSSSVQNDGNQDHTEKDNQKAKEIAAIEWPQLVLLVKSTFNFG